LYLKEIWDKDLIFEGQHGFRPGFSYDCKVIALYQDIPDYLDNGGRIDAVIVDFLVPDDRLLRKIVTTVVDPRVLVWIREFLLGRTEGVRVGGQLSDAIKSNIRSIASKCSWFLGSLLFLTYVNDVWSQLSDFADDCVIYRKILSNNDMENLQI
jgi:hypothetical protein